MISFLDKLAASQSLSRSVLCVGIDPDPARMPTSMTASYPTAEAVKAFTTAIIDATAPYACAYKLNFAFFESLGPYGYDVLRQTLAQIPAHAVTIADAKRGDIGNTAIHYARAILDDLGFDACTVAPYMGSDAVAPFLGYPDKAAFVLARTSNPSAADFQETQCGSERLYERVARYIARWDSQCRGTAGLVVGATAPGALSELRRVCPTQPFLIPGLGAQGGDPSDVGAAAAGPIIVSSSRSILYAEGGADFAIGAAEAARRTRDRLVLYLPKHRWTRPPT